MQTHFQANAALWTEGNRIQTMLCRCILCGDPEGATVVFARVWMRDDGRLMLAPDGISNSLCPDCRAKHAPVSTAMRNRLNKLSDKAWQKLKRRGCPCCDAGIEWQQAPLVH